LKCRTLNPLLPGIVHCLSFGFGYLKEEKICLAFRYIFLYMWSYKHLSHFPGLPISIPWPSKDYLWPFGILFYHRNCDICQRFYQVTKIRSSEKDTSKIFRSFIFCWQTQLLGKFQRFCCSNYPHRLYKGHHFYHEVRINHGKPVYSCGSLVPHPLFGIIIGSETLGDLGLLVSKSFEKFRHSSQTNTFLPKGKIIFLWERGLYQN